MNSTDLKQIESLLKKELKNFATKDDLKNFATKDDLKRILSNYPTKKDLKRELNNLAIELTVSVDEHKAERRKVEGLEKRVERIEEELQISTI